MGFKMDLYDDLNAIWVDCASVFLMLSFLVFVCCLIWQAIKNKRAQETIIAQYMKNLEIIEELKNRF